jgi:hypothetical protein
VIVGRPVWDVHPFDMFNQLVWRQFDILPADRKAAVLTIVPFKFKFFTVARIRFADGHS